MGIEDVADATRRQAAQGAELRVAVDFPIIRRENALRRIIVPVLSDENAGLAALQRARRDAGVLQRLPAYLHHQPLLGVEAFRLARGKAKELRVELVDIVEVIAVADIHLARHGHFRIVMPIHIPAFARDFAQDIAARLQKLPERIGRSHPAGVAAAQADDGDRLARRGFRFGERCAQARNLRIRLFERERLSAPGP